MSLLGQCALTISLKHPEQRGVRIEGYDLQEIHYITAPLDTVSLCVRTYSWYLTPILLKLAPKLTCTPTHWRLARKYVLWYND